MRVALIGVNSITLCVVMSDSGVKTILQKINDHHMHSRSRSIMRKGRVTEARIKTRSEAIREGLCLLVMRGLHGTLRVEFVDHMSRTQRGTMNG